MRASILEGVAFCLILGLGACADGLADILGGMAFLMGGVAFSGLLIHLAHVRPWASERAHTKVREGRQSVLITQHHYRQQRPTQGKKKAATVVTTPQRQVKQSDYANISRPYFTDVKGKSQI